MGIESMTQFFKVAAPGITCVFALISCFCWLRSATAQVLYRPGNYPPGTSTRVEKSTKGTFAVYATAKLQSRWNKLAAASASIGAFFQAVTTYSTSVP
jgi:hypothetical protein